MHSKPPLEEEGAGDEREKSEVAEARNDDVVIVVEDSHRDQGNSGREKGRLDRRGSADNSMQATLEDHSLVKHGLKCTQYR